ncbi:MAG: hypothetical protein ACE5FJ_07505 [Gemmatimonadales bacterium]
MKYFHRTSLSPDEVLAEADGFLGGRLDAETTATRTRSFTSVLGSVKLSVRAEGGHYTLITADTDQPGESELDKLVKRYMGRVHARVDGSHELRGAY